MISIVGRESNESNPPVQIGTVNGAKFMLSYSKIPSQGYAGRALTIREEA